MCLFIGRKIGFWKNGRMEVVVRTDVHQRFLALSNLGLVRDPFYMRVIRLRRVAEKIRLMRG